MPMLSMKTKKPMKPMLEIAEITDDAGLSRPSHPASAPTSRPSHPIHRGSARVVRMATAYSGTTTPKPRKLPAALVTRARRQRCRWLYTDQPLTWTCNRHAAYVNTLEYGRWKIIGVGWDTGEKIAEITLSNS